jgi:hypothetical protein
MAMSTNPAGNTATSRCWQATPGVPNTAREPTGDAPPTASQAEQDHTPPFCPAELAIVAEEAGMDTEHHIIAELLALKDAPDDVLLDQVQAIGVTAARAIVYDEAKRLRYTDRQAKMDCIALMNRINELIRPA